MMVLGSRKKINPPTCLPFAPSSALRKRLHSNAMRPFTRLEEGTKSSAFWGIYFLPQPLYYKRYGYSLRRYFPSKQGTYCFFMMVFLASAFLSFFIKEPLYAGSQDKIIILNSDTSVEKYSYVQAEFKSGAGTVEARIDLGNKWRNEPKIKKEILKIAPDIIYCIGSGAFKFASELTVNADLVFSMVINWQRLPIGENVYGISNEFPHGMQLTTYRYFFPDINKIGVLYSKAYNKEWFEIAVKSAKDSGIEIIGEPVRKSKEVKKSLKKLLANVDAIMLIPDPTVLKNVESVNTIFKQSEAAKKPVFAYNKVFTNFGAVLVVAPDIKTTGNQAGNLVNDLLAGHKIEKRIQYPAGSHIILNLKKVDEYGINLNENALDSVNEIIR